MTYCDEVNKEVTNPWAKYTTKSLRKGVTSRAATQFHSLSNFAAIKNIGVVTANSKLLHLGPQVTGKDKCNI